MGRPACSPTPPQIADQLIADIKDLQSRVAPLSFTPVELANGAKELLDEVATGKITGEEDRYSHTDLWDFKANVEGCQGAVAGAAAGDRRQGPDARPDARRAVRGRRRSCSPTYRAGDGYKLYTDLTEPTRRR